MKQHNLGIFTLTEVVELTRNKRVVLLSPRLNNRNILLGNLITRPRSYLYRLSADDADLLMWLKHISDDLAYFTSGFGKQLQQSLNQRGSVDDLAESFAKDLREVDIETLILDELDRLQVTPQTVAFFEHFVEKLPSSIQLVLNGRNISCNPFNQMVRAGIAVVLGEEKALTGAIYNSADTQCSHVEIYAFGSGTVRVNGLPVDNWDGPLPRNLFYYLIDHPLVTRDDIFSTFWPELNTKEATNVFHVTKRKMSLETGH